ncbi:MAG: hypothetical protein JNM10_17700 [Planctomycetia bacterium]|nr:hypothetical protein [Planctomycetia bacterium]
MRSITLGLVALLATGAVARAADAPPAPHAAPPAASAEPAPDVFAEVVKEAGLADADLGFRPKTTWPRYPHVVPFKAPFFDDLLADARGTYAFTRTLGNVVEDVLTTEQMTVAPKEGPGALYRLAVALGVDRRIGGIRGFGFGLHEPKPAAADPLADALARLLVAAGDPLAADPKALAERVKVVPDVYHLPLARLVLATIDARRWIDVGLRHVTPAQRAAVFAALNPPLAAREDDARTVPLWEDVARVLDEHALAYGSLKAMEAVQRARWELAAARPTEEVEEAGEDGKPPTKVRQPKELPSFELRLPTPWGTVLFDNSGVNTQTADAPFLVVRAWASNNWSGGIAHTAPDRPLSLALVLTDRVGGDRIGEDYGIELQEPEAERTAGLVASGILGCGVLYVAGDTHTYYKGDRLSLGAGFLGVGVLVDEGGDDEYACLTGQGAGTFGVGLLLDVAGDDEYRLLEGDGQGYGGPGGAGVLADRAGNDRYAADPKPETAGKGRADYHSDQKIVSSCAQGAGFGRRGDVNDGHAWAGGLGALLDVDGDDTYDAGNFSQGCGFWFGTGLLYDGGGNDAYRSVYFSHGSGAHFAVGAVVDEGGDDQHLLLDWAKVDLGPKAGAGVGFGWDVVNAFVFDRAGNDRYEADIISLGCANVRSHGWLLDEGGDDVYVANAGALAFGAIDERPDYAVPSRGSGFTFFLPQTSFLLDLGGADRYLRRPAGGGDPVPDADAGDGKAWGKDGPRGPGGGPNVARGRDVARGRLGFLDAWPRRVAPVR